MANRDDRTNSPSQNREDDLDRNRGEERMRGGVSGDTRGRAQDEEEFEESDDDVEMIDDEDDDGR